MNSILSQDLWLHSRSFLQEDVVIRELLLSHDPDGRHLDSEQLLRAMENIMCYATASEVLVSDMNGDTFGMNNESNIEVVGSQEPLGHTIYQISREILCKCSGEGNLHARTMIMFDLLGNYRWDAKMVLVLAAFATSYGEFWLIMQLYPQNPLAVSVAVLKHLPSDISILKRRFKALSLLIKSMVEVTKCIIKFEGLPFVHVMMDNEIIAITKSHIFIAAYWVTRSTLICSSHIKDLIVMKAEYSNDSTTIAAWELSSLVRRLCSICNHLRRQVDACHRETETKLHQMLIELFKRSLMDNQELLRILFALKNELPLKKCSTQEKLSVSELKDKVVILLVSKPELPLEELFFLIHQTYDHPHTKNLTGSYEILWVPISSSDTWTDADERSFEFLSSTLPWLSVRQPQLLNSAVVNFIKQEWNFKDEPVMVVLDSQGMVTNSNSLDMILIWGARGYPFSVLKEIELWEEENWTLQFMIDEIDPLLNKWVEEGRNICLYGGENLDWISEFNAKMMEIRSKGLQVEMVYVGSKYLSEKVRNILAIINEKMHSSLLSFTKLKFFWFRMESMRKSKLRLGKEANTDHILKEVSALLNTDDNDNGWAVFGKGSSPDILRFRGRKLMECLNLFPKWGENVAKFGFVGAIRNTVEPPDLTESCDHSNVIPYAEGIVVCEKCLRLLKEFVVYE
ncbi:Sieve element occlusion [Melia azedarach]|uniref:Sieve element occlusion n=1 Tax=Melia azedarach TaxID=155640 RepID=A0ACC1XIJ7_MELAZ|nr:Sieve element occlusion [Melia azedarach]